MADVQQQQPMDVEQPAPETPQQDPSAQAESKVPEQGQAAVAKETAAGFVTRFTSYPVVQSAFGQVNNAYSSVKNHNVLFRATLATAESGVKTVAGCALPVVQKTLETQIEMVDSFACNQLTKLEEKCPIVTAPTEKVVEKTREYCTMNVNVQANVKVVTETGVRVVTAPYHLSRTAVVSTTNYGKEKMTQLGQYGMQKLNGALDTRPGQYVTGGVEKCLTYADNSVDYILPSEEGATDEVAVQQDKAVEKQPAQRTLKTAGAICSKVKRRSVKCTRRNMQRLHTNTQNALQNVINYIDLVTFAKTHLDNVPANVQAVRQKMEYYLKEINKTDTATAGDGEDNARAVAAIEMRILATTRHMVLKLKQSLGVLNNTATAVIPSPIINKLLDAKVYVENYYNNLMQTESLHDLPQYYLTEASARFHTLKQFLSTMASYIPIYNSRSGEEAQNVEPENPAVNVTGQLEPAPNAPGQDQPASEPVPNVPGQAQPAPNVPGQDQPAPIACGQEQPAQQEPAPGAQPVQDQPPQEHPAPVDPQQAPAQDNPPQNENP